MAADRFVQEMAGAVASLVIHAIRHDALPVNGSGGASNGSKPAAKAPPKLLVRVSEAAVMLSRTEKAVRQLIFKGELKAIRHGRSVRIAVADILEFIERDRV
jgi:excisionase family DNA binding protein